MTDAPQQADASATAPRSTPWPDAMLVAALLAVDGHGLGGVILRDRAGDAAARWLDRVRDLLPLSTPVRRMPSHISDDRLVGGLDLAGTLASGRRVLARGLLAEADGGFVQAPGADRLSAMAVAHLTAALDRGVVAIERDGLSALASARFALIAYDDGRDDSEPVSTALADRMAFALDLDARDMADGPTTVTRDDVAAARVRSRHVEISDEMVDAVCKAALSCGIVSIRAPVLAVRAARVLAALAGRDQVEDEDAEAASRLVLGPRIVAMPEQPQQQAQPPEPEPPPLEESSEQATDERPPDPPESEQSDDADMPSIEDLVLAAATARLPSELIDRLQSSAKLGRGHGAGRRSRIKLKSLRRGRPVGVRAETRRGAQRLDLVATLRAAAPWQRLRQAALQATEPTGRILVRREDFHVKRLKQTPTSVAVFVVDASGSSALNRLAEAKGAVELLLADCYVRRDEVALVAFRGKTADVLLAPTKSLVRAKRSLAGLPGGGGTPLASGLDAAAELAAACLRKGHSPILVVLTDGRANVARDGAPGRPKAEADALAAARQMRLLGVAILVVDTSPRPDPMAARLAEAMAARYLALPYADAATLSTAVKRTANEVQAEARPGPPNMARS